MTEGNGEDRPTVLQSITQAAEVLQELHEHRADIRKAGADIKALGADELAQLRALDFGGLVSTTRDMAEEVVELCDTIEPPAPPAQTA